MANDIKSNVVDQPAKAGEDKLDMRAYADALTEFIRNAQSPLTIALQGEWGSGKTSLMNALKASLVDDEDAPFLGVCINTWQYALMSDTEDAIKNILRGLISQLPEQEKSEQPERKKKAMKLLSTFGRTATVGLANIAGSFVGAGQIGSEFSKAYDAEKEPMEELITDGESPVDKLKKQLTGMVADCCKANSAEEATDGKKCGILIFIDDLDRIDPPVAVQILELLKNIFDIPKCIFVLAIDYGVVVKGLEHKFGAMTAKNEREFRSFFDKIIQLPFSMPVANYKINSFLIDSLADIGFLDDSEKSNSDFREALTAYALDSVGTNPRSLKRLINYLSLIKLIIERTPTQEDDDDFKKWKDILFALVSLQIQYPKIYNALRADSDFPNWGEAFEQKMRLPELKDGEKVKLEKMTEFDERWEQLLFRLCRNDIFLEARALNISRMLNRIKVRITETNQPIGSTIEWLMSLSSVTNVKSELTQATMPESFSSSQYLKDLRGTTLGLKDIWTNDGTHGWETVLPNGPYLACWMGAVKTQLILKMWVGCSKWTDFVGDFISEPHFRITHDGKCFLLSLQGQFWGDSPEAEINTFIDFAADDIQPDLAAAKSAYCVAWGVFSGNVNKSIDLWDGGIFWDATIPFKDHDELVSEDFSQKLRKALSGVANAFASLLKYRVPVNQ